jgi:hypothetical protein
VNVKGIKPFHLLSLYVLRCIVMLNQVSIGQFPEDRRHDDAADQIIPHDGGDNKGNGGEQGFFKGNGIGDAGEEQK